MASEGDEATKADVVKLLVPRFRDQGAANEEQATARAELCLDRQELRSGLLVSRRSHSYRFVHLTFQEYLAAWHLSNQEFDQALELIQPHLRQQKWFEVLQPTTWLLICEAVNKDSNSDVRGRACALLLQSLGCSELQLKLMSRSPLYLYGYDGYGPWHDPKRRITSARVTEAAQRFNLSVDEVRQQYEAIAAQLPVELSLVWRKGR